jgi:hypothetical protein
MAQNSLLGYIIVPAWSINTALRLQLVHIAHINEHHNLQITAY